MQRVVVESVFGGGGDWEGDEGGRGEEGVEDCEGGGEDWKDGVSGEDVGGVLVGSEEGGGGGVDVGVGVSSEGDADDDCDGDSAAADGDDAGGSAVCDVSEKILTEVRNVVGTASSTLVEALEFDVVVIPRSFAAPCDEEITLVVV